MPPRMRMPRWWKVSLALVGAGYFIFCLANTEFIKLTTGGSGLGVSAVWEIPASLWRLAGQMFPPSLSNMGAVGMAMLETFEMALLGTVVGVLVSFPLAILASHRHSPHTILYLFGRGIISLARTVPDLVWAFFFVATVGLGPLAGALTLTVDTIGFAGRFFAEGMEDVDRRPEEALSALGAGHVGVVFGAVVPGAFPSFINTALFSFERAVRSSVVLGYVAAGGIGRLLEGPMTWMEYDKAATVILAIFAMVLAGERASAYMRQRVMANSNERKAR